MKGIKQPSVSYNGAHLIGGKIKKVIRTLKDVKDIFSDTDAGRDLSPEAVIYEVELFLPVPEDTSGGLFFGVTFVYPGKVGNEYFMTRGHFHKMPNRAEFYWCVEGEGMLILMDRNRNTWAEKMCPGTLHYIDGYTAHRTANTGKGILSFGACWPSDAGYDYDTIAKNGFSKILIEQNGIPLLVDQTSDVIKGQ